MSTQLQQLAKTYYSERSALFTLLILSVCFFVCYIYFVSAAIVHVVVRDELIGKSSDVASEISDLEAEYFTHAQVITTDFALRSGFVPLTEKAYVERTQRGVALNNR